MQLPRKLNTQLVTSGLDRMKRLMFLKLVRHSKYLKQTIKTKNMNFKSLFLIGLIAFVTVNCTKEKNDLFWQEACGNVKSIRTTGYEATEKFGEISEGDVLYDDEINNLIEFNKEGYITEISNFNHSGNLSKKSIYVFDGDGKVSKINKYDAAGNEIGRTIFTYNDNQKVTKIVDYDKSGKVNFTQRNEWDGDNCTKRQFINEYSEGNYNMYEFDGNILVKSVVYDKNGQKTGEYTEYENEKIKKIVTKDFTISLTYNDKGYCSSIVNGQLFTTNTYYWAKGESYTYDYEYDGNGNWIRKVERKKASKKATRIFVREIEYY